MVPTVLETTNKIEKEPLLNVPLNLLETGVRTGVYTDRFLLSLFP